MNWGMLVHHPTSCREHARRILWNERHGFLRKQLLITDPRSLAAKEEDGRIPIRKLIAHLRSDRSYELAQLSQHQLCR